MLTTEIPVISVMTIDPVTIKPDTSIAQVKELLKEHQIRHLPVVEKQNVVVGIVSITDLAMFDRFESKNSSLTASDLMTKEVIGLSPDDSIGLAADMFLSRALHAAPVIDDGELVGIVTSHDLLRRVFADVLPLDNSRAA